MGFEKGNKLGKGRPTKVEEETTQECQCYKVVYTYEQYYQGGTWQWVYIEVSSEVLNTTNCQETNYVNMGNGNFYRIECR